MKRVMVVDDERPVVEGIVLMVQRDLGEEFAVVGSASSGREALERFGDLAPDIVLMDVSMPGISGLEAIRELRRRSSNAAFILVTAYERFDIAREAVELGLGGYLLKPVSRETLARSLRAAAAVLDRQREGERSLVELHERGEALLPFVEEALLEGLMLGDHRHDRREAALALLGIGETLALAVALAFAPEPGLPDPEKEVESLHARLRETLRYRSRALVGPIFSRTSLVLLPCRDAQDAQRRVVEFRLGVEKALGPELIRGTVRLGLGAARPWALAGESWSEALAALGGAEARPSPGPWSESGDRADFSEDEDFLRLLIDGDESRAALSLGRILDAACGADSEGGSSSKAGPDFGGRVPAAAAGRVVALFGTAYRLLARRGLLAPHETQALLDLRELATEAQAGPWRLAAEARFSRLHEVLTRQVRHSPAVNKALAHIAANYPRPIGLESTAELVGLSPSRLSRLLVEETGRGFSELLIDRRIERAKELLADSGTSIKEVSLASGYADPNYFARLFKKVTGLPPTAWAAGRMEDNDA